MFYFRPWARCTIWIAVSGYCHTVIESHEFTSSLNSFCFFNVSQLTLKPFHGFPVLVKCHGAHTDYLYIYIRIHYLWNQKKKVSLHFQSFKIWCRQCRIYQVDDFTLTFAQGLGCAAMVNMGYPPTWRIIPVSKWLITMVRKSPK